MEASGLGILEGLKSFLRGAGSLTPQKGEDSTLRAREVIMFKCSPVLRNRVNARDEEILPLPVHCQSGCTLLTLFGVKWFGSPRLHQHSLRECCHGEAFRAKPGVFFLPPFQHSGRSFADL
jgi:hypothetical protein